VRITYVCPMATIKIGSRLSRRLKLLLKEKNPGANKLTKI
jgi:hypothetical protein